MISVLWKGIENGSRLGDTLPRQHTKREELWNAHRPNLTFLHVLLVQMIYVLLFCSHSALNPVSHSLRILLNQLET